MFIYSSQAVKTIFFFPPPIEQLDRLFAATNRLSYKVFFFTACSMGLHLGEGINIQRCQ